MPSDPWPRERAATRFYPGYAIYMPRQFRENPSFRTGWWLGTPPGTYFRGVLPWDDEYVIEEPALKEDA